MILAYLDPEDERLLEEDVNTPTDSKRWDFDKSVWYIFLQFSLFKSLFCGCFLSMKDEHIWNFFADLDNTILMYHGYGKLNTFLQSTTDSHRNQITRRESKSYIKYLPVICYWYRLVWEGYFFISAWETRLAAFEWCTLLVCVSTHKG